MRILLLQPRHRANFGFNSFALTEPLGLEYVAAHLPKTSSVKLVDDLEGVEILEEARKFAPQLVGVNCSFTAEVPHTLEVLASLRAVLPEAFIAVGGHHSSLAPEDFFSSPADAVVIGEGEITFAALARALADGEELQAVKGLALKTESGWHFTGRRPLLKGEGIRAPARWLTHKWRSKYFLGARKPLAVLETTRGCPFRCNFCSVWRFFGAKVRFRPLDYVLAELESRPEPHVLFADDNFFIDPARSLELARRIQARQIRKHYVIQARTDAIVKHPEVIEAWKEVGLERVFLGLEKVSDEALERLNKHNTAANNDRALAILGKLKIGVTGSFIVDPDYTHEDFAEMLRYTRSRPIDACLFGVLTPLPGTDLFDEVKHRITTTDKRLFDLQHSVLPTWLDRRTFYRELAQLERKANLGLRQFLSLPRLFWASLTGKLGSLGHLLRVAWRTSSMFKPEVFLERF